MLMEQRNTTFINTNVSHCAMHLVFVHLSIVRVLVLYIRLQVCIYFKEIESTKFVRKYGEQVETKGKELKNRQSQNSHTMTTMLAFFFTVFSSVSGALNQQFIVQDESYGENWIV